MATENGNEKLCSVQSTCIIWLCTKQIPESESRLCSYLQVIELASRLLILNSIASTVGASYLVQVVPGRKAASTHAQYVQR